MPPARPLVCLAALASALLTAAPPAQAGCGCDHPPPAWSLVMPPFGSPGRTLQIVADGFAFEAGGLYEVDFGGHHLVQVEAGDGDRLKVELPGGVPPGPVAIGIRGPGVDVVYPSALFTALPRARRIKERSGTFAARNYDAAIGADGTLYLALDVSKVLDPMQFTFALHGLGLHFAHDDVVIYNADGVDLTLFTLEVEDATERQWGSYYGWTVESDAGLPSTYYVPKSIDSGDPLEVSSVFTYWRHEFHTYAGAHASGGSHELDALGFHPDGTVHIDHESLVIAIQGLERDASDPLDLSKAAPLDPGSREVDVAWLSLVTEGPLELEPLVSEVTAEQDDDDEELQEVLPAP